MYACELCGCLANGCSPLSNAFGAHGGASDVGQRPVVAPATNRRQIATVASLCFNHMKNSREVRQSGSLDIAFYTGTDFSTV